ncbi:hypothetical protein HGRIS_001594 [Hohenbuehelia grisea]|uniref:Uncharacterized protein n=1 Tax=Hohenbuehelia grisea TaxID=104357 RepID=A0ABR3JJL9_9AGAR
MQHMLPQAAQAAPQGSSQIAPETPNRAPGPAIAQPNERRTTSTSRSQSRAGRSESRTAGAGPSGSRATDAGRESRTALRLGAAPSNGPDAAANIYELFHLD